MASKLAHAPRDGADVSMSFSGRFFLFAFMVVLALLGVFIVIVWMVLSAG